MFLRRLELTDVGVFSKKHTISFEKSTKSRPVILIGALNGGGKTTVLNSLQVALYGNRALGIDRTKRGYATYLKELKNRSANPDSTSTIELDFDLRQNGESINYKIQRNWRFKNDALEESFIVLRNNIFDDFLSGNWTDFFESILPSRLAHLFFFDGEQIEQMADETAAQNLLKTAFKSLLGLDVVERLQEDLVVLERRKKASIQDPSNQLKIEELDRSCEREEKKLQEIHDRIAVQQRLLDQAKDEVEKARTLYKEKGGDHFENREALEKEYQALQQQINERISLLQAILAGHAFLLPMAHSLKEISNGMNSDSFFENNDSFVKFIKIRDRKIQGELKAFLNEKDLKKVMAIFERHESRASTDKAIGWDTMAAQVHLKALLNGPLNSDRERISEITKHLEELRIQHLAKERLLASVPDQDSIKVVQKTMESCEKRYVALAQTLSDLNQVFRQTEIELNSYNKLREKELGLDLQNWSKENHTVRVLASIPKITETLRVFSESVLNRHVGALEQKITECFQFLLRKPDFIGRVSINPTTFELSLLDTDRKPIPFSLLSAGERQILATSILWGLSKVSGRPIPLVIDTPLGRLDSNHRENLVQRYFPTASHQVILLSTDEEIVNGYHESLKPFISKSFLLEFDPKQKSSSIREAYFRK